MPLDQPVPQADESAQLATVAVVGGNFFSRIEVVSVIAHEEGFEADSCPAGPDAVRRMLAERPPDIVAVLEDANTASVLQELVRSGPGPRVVVVAPSPKHAGNGIARSSIAGTHIHRIHRASLVPALRLIRSGYRVRAVHGTWADGGSVHRRVELWLGEHQLTARETEVAELMIRGLSNVEIAEGLELSGATVKSHVHSLMSKLNLNNRIDVITTAYRSGLARPHRPRYEPTPVPTLK